MQVVLGRPRDLLPIYSLLLVVVVMCYVRSDVLDRAYCNVIALIFRTISDNHLPWSS